MNTTIKKMRTSRICIVSALQMVLLVSHLGHGQEIAEGDHLSDTELLSADDAETLRPRMLKGMLGYFKQALASSPQERQARWNRNYSSSEAYRQSVASNRARLKKITGVVDERSPVEALTLVETTTQKALVAETENYTVYSVRWPVLEGVHGAGLWVEPRGNVRAQVVALPEASWTPEMLMGLSTGVPSEARFASRLASSGCRVIIPTLINREDTWSGNPDVRMTNQPHREFIYRRAYELGHHIIGYEVQKVLAAVDWFSRKNRETSTDLPIAVAGYGEGGLIAFYSGAMDPRIDGTLVSGYFQEREEVWKEPIYRNVWGLLEEFGDAEIAGLIAPRHLVIEACRGPEVDGPPVATGDRADVASPGRLQTPPLESVRREAGEAKKAFQKLGIPEKFRLVTSGEGRGHPGTTEALRELLSGIGVEPAISRPPQDQLKDQRADFDPDSRMQDQFRELLDHTDKLVGQSEKQREAFWDDADPSSVEQWRETTGKYREYFWEELIGKMPEPSQSFNARTRLAYETSNWRGYWVELDVWPRIIAGGVLLIPKDLQPEEERPVVVCQHGLGGRLEPLVDPDIESVYYSFGAQLADQGYIVYAPQNPYGLFIEEPRYEKNFRIVQRMANPLKKSLFSVIIGQHDQTLNWLKQLSFVDGNRIGFYGLSYGGKTAMRVPPVLKDYSVVVCSGDFNEWVWKTTSLDVGLSYMTSGEYEIFEFNLSGTLNYAEMAGLIAPRPFMVERGHWDGVAPDEWVAYEYAKVRRLYDRMGIGGRTRIEFFNGPHEIHGIGTFKFLNRHLKPSKK